LLQTGRISQAISAGIDAEHFHRHQQEYQYLHKFYMKHSETPTVKVFCERFPDFAFVKTSKKSVRIKPAVESVVDNHVAISLARLLKTSTEQLDEMPASEILDNMTAQLTKIQRTQNGDQDVNIASDFETDFAEFLRVRASVTEEDQSAVTIRTPWPAVNDFMGGWQPGTVTGVLARPNVGKSWIVDQAAVVAGLDGHRVYLASLEMKRRQTVARIHSLASFYMSKKKGKKGKYVKINLPALVDNDIIASLLGDKRIFRNSHLGRKPHLIDADEYQAFGQEFERAMSGGFFVPEINRRSGAFTLQTFITKVERTEAEIAFLDYLGLLEIMQSKGTQRWETWAQISANLKMAAEHLDIPFVVALQANRNGALVKTPEIADIADSDTIARDLDNVLSLSENDDGLSMTCIKHRAGEKNWRVPILFFPEWGVVEQNMHAEVERGIL
jgi:hypothetical protein